MNNNAVLHRYTWSPVGLDTPVSVYDASANATYYYDTDANKNITELTDATGAVVAHYEYSPFGKVLVANGEYASINPFRFSSEYHDDESGLVYYNYRYYSPELGRWLKPDPIEEKGGWNLYAMVRNNTSNHWDKFGLAWWEWIPVVSTIGHIIKDPQGIDAGDYVIKTPPTDKECCEEPDIAAEKTRLCKNYIDTQLGKYVGQWFGVTIGPDLFKTLYTGTGVYLIQKLIARNAISLVGGVFTAGILTADSSVDLGVQLSKYLLMRQTASALKYLCECSK